MAYQSKPIKRGKAAVLELEKSQSALKELPGVIRKGGLKRQRAAQMGAAEATGAALRSTGTRALTSGAAVGQVAGIGAKTRSAAAAQMADAETAAVTQEAKGGLQTAAILDEVSSQPAGADDYLAQKAEFKNLLTTQMGENWNVDAAMLSDIRYEIDQIEDPTLRSLMNAKLDNLASTLESMDGGFINIQKAWQDADGTMQSFWDIDDDVYVSSLRDDDASVTTTGETSPLDT